MANAVTVLFTPGFRLIDGTDLNNVVSQVNTALGGGSAGTFSTLSTTGTASFANVINVGSSGAAGTINLFPATAAKGNVAITAANNAGNTVTTLNFAAQAGARTYTVPDTGAASGSFVMSNTGLSVADFFRTSAPVTVNGSTTYVDVTGLLATVVPGTYQFTAILPSTVANGTGGIKYAFHYVGTVISVMEATSKGFTASAVAVQHTTTTTDVADLFTQAAVVIYTEINGTFVVTTGGTIQVQMAQNTSNASNTVALVGGSFEVNRIA